VKFAFGKTVSVALTAPNLRQFLGQRRVLPEERLTHDQIGIATGLAWTPTGGEILYVEAQAMKGKGSLILTGQMGDVMKESAMAALSYTRAHAKDYQIDEEFFTSHDFHIHIPEGAIPKDGPSAGITLATALVSVCTRRPVRTNIAMTGEITLRGDVLSVGGIKEKFLAAHRGQVQSVILPGPNKKDLEEVPKDLREQLQLILVAKVNEVLRKALV